MTSEAAGLGPGSPIPAAGSDPARASSGSRYLLWLLLPLGFFAVMVLFYSFRFVFEFDPDEGINAIKALLALRGFPLYTQVWSDQPPVFTFLLAAWFRLFGMKVVAGRLLVLVFSTLLAAAVIHHLQRGWGVLAAVCGFFLLILLPQYTRLSVSIMIGLPAIAFGFLSVWALSLWHAQRRPIWIALSSVFLGLAIFTKGFMLILLPCVAVGIALTLRRSPSPRFIWTSLAAWVIPLAVIGLAMLFVIRPENLGQLADVHLAAQVNPAFQTSVVLPTINTYLSRSIPLLILAGLGAYQTIRMRSWVGLYLLGWALLAYFGLLLNRPTWPHHELLVTVPAAILAAIGAAAALREIWHRLRRRTRLSLPLGTALVGVLALAALVLTRLPDFLREFNLRLPNFGAPSAESSAESLAERQIVALMADHAEETHWVYAENAMFAFQAGLSVPPPLAVLSRKRLETGSLTDAQVLEVLEAYKPELVLESRFFLPAAEEYMRLRNFTRLDSTPKYRLYLRKDSS